MFPVIHRLTSQQRAALLAFAILFAPGLLNGLYFKPLWDLHPALFWAADAMQWLVLPLIAYFAVLRPAGIGLVQLGFRTHDATGRDITDSLGTIVLITVALFAGTTLANRILFFLFRNLGTFNFGYYSAIPDSEILGPLVAMWYSLSAGFVEEATYRGLTWYFMTTLAVSTWDKRRYISISSVLFGLVHWEQGVVGVLGAAFFGYWCAVFYANRRNLWPIVVAHAWYDIYCFWPDIP